MSPAPAHSPPAKGDEEVVSQRTFPGQGEAPEVVGVAPKDDSSDAGRMGGKPPWGLVMGAKFNSPPSRIPFRTPTRLRSQASSLPRKDEVCLFRW